MFRSQVLTRLGLVSILLLLVDLYAFQGLKMITRNSSFNWRLIIYGVYWSATVFTVYTLIYTSLGNANRLQGHAPAYILSIIVTAYLAKLIVAAFLLINDLIRLLRWLIVFISRSSEVQHGVEGITRYQFINTLGWIAAGAMTGLLVQGMWNIDRYKVKRLTLKFPNLPMHMDGYTIAQISDIHTGSFTSGTPLKEAVELINRLDADIVVFTGDLVNNASAEALPYIDILKNIKSKKGIYSITGNHDYADYRWWPDDAAKQKDVQQLFDIHGELGWNLLKDEHRYLDDEKQVALIGVQNISGLKSFHSYGDFNKALTGSEDAAFRILLSHDPTHWDTEVSTHPTHIDLTLSGHTHGMQFGINIPGFIKWSPSQWIFKHWLGLYNQGNKYLYVSPGLGFLGYPGRVGIMPEITVFELKKSDA